MASSACAATIACFQYQVKFSRGQICPLHKCPVLSGFRRRQTSVRCSTRVSNMAEFFEPRKLKTQVDDLKVRLSEAVPEPVKEIPWKKAKHMLLQRLLPTAERALKWSVLGMFIISSFSDVLFSISRNRELLIPFALFIGCMVADFLKETSQELFQSTQDARRRLLGISFFFVLVKVVSVYFSVGAGIFLTHLGNGGLIQVLWLWKKLHEKSESNEKEISSSFKESSTAT